MRHCNNCLMPDTKPGLFLDERGFCQACCRAQTKKNIDYKRRFEQLKQLCEKHKRKDSYYDCIIAISGGKDSHYQVYLLKEILGMNPLLVSAGDPFTKTKAGLHNIRNICDVFNCDLNVLQVNPNLVRRMVRIAFEEFGSPSWPVDRAIYCYPVRMAINMKIPLVIYGENVSWEYGGVQNKETYSAKEQINNDAVKKVDWDLWYKNGITDKELNMLIYPSQEEIDEAQLDPVYLSYFTPWDGCRNYSLAKKYGFKDLTHEWKREGYIEDYDQIDSIGYIFGIWMKYPKFGFSRATDVVGYWIRSGKITKEEGIKLIRENDHKLDPIILEDFLNFTGYTHKEFWNIVEKFWNPDIFEKIGGEWKMKEDKLPTVKERDDESIAGCL